MRPGRRFWAGLAIAGVVGVAAGCSSAQTSLPKLEPKLRADLAGWLEKNGVPPEEYVAAKFADHDIVFLGEYHRIREDPLFVQGLIPLLYRQGVRTLGLEFLAAHDQPGIDRLLAAKTYDDSLARRLFWNWWPWWGYQEYVGILEAAWCFNRQLPDGARPFRVVGLNARQDWSYMRTPKDREDPKVMKKVFPDGDSDFVMAETIRREILAKGEKALVYSGINHAYTKFRQPVVDEKTGKLVKVVSSRMGNRIHDEIGERCITLFLHAPWPAAAGYEVPDVYPADGVIDAVFSEMPPEARRRGFDLANSSFGRLRADSSLWSHASDDFRLEMYCDGWIYQGPIAEYEGVGVVPGWFNERNRADAIAQLANPDPRVKDRDHTVEYLTDALASDARIQRRFAHLH